MAFLALTAPPSDPPLRSHPLPQSDGSDAAGAAVQPKRRGDQFADGPQCFQVAPHALATTAASVTIASIVNSLFISLLHF